MGHSIHRLDRPALFALLPDSGDGMLISELMHRARLNPAAYKAVQACMQEWRQRGAVRKRGRGYPDRRGVLWVRVWSLARFADDRAFRRRHRAPAVAPAVSPAVGSAEELEPAAVDYTTACRQVHSVGAMCAAWLERR